MKIFHSCIFITVFIFSVNYFWGCASTSASNEVPIQEISFTEKWDTVRVLENPHKGWYHHLIDNGIHQYPVKDDSIFESFPGMDHLYLRLAWSFLEPKEGEFDWHYIDEVVEKYVPKGYKISFRITCSETGSYPNSVGEEVDGVQYATPSWVRKAGAKGNVVERRNTSWIPHWGDPVFLEKMDQFHRAFASRYDGQPWVSYVDIGSIGDWGEGHTGRTKTPASMDDVKANIDFWVKNYKKTQLVVSDDLLYSGRTKNETKELFQYVVSKGISLRDDSPMVIGLFKNHLKTWTVRSPELYDPLYIQMPIILELGHYHQLKSNGVWLGKNGADIIKEYGYSGATVVRKAIETLRATYIGYHGYAEEWLAENPDLTKELANLCGYWYFPVRASFPSELNRDKNEFSIVWFNKGVAPAYNAFDLILRFESDDSKNSFDVEVNSGNKNWLPGISKTEKYQISIPSNVIKGNYTVKFMLSEKTGDNIQPIQIGVKESIIDANMFVTIGKVQVK